MIRGHPRRVMVPRSGETDEINQRKSRWILGLNMLQLPEKQRREHAVAEAFGLGEVLRGEDGNIKLDAWPCLALKCGWVGEVALKDLGRGCGGVAGRPRHRARVGWPVAAACGETRRATGFHQNYLPQVLKPV
uniref:Uncharacterized protein n=1 Tax=Oryza nivara TaxID=4536 RepID=A0A0E0GX59_ORYNI